MRRQRERTAGRRRLLVGAVFGVSLLVTMACSSSQFTGVEELPLPGGADLGDDPYHVTVQFDDVLDLVPHSMVKVHDVEVGTVEETRLGADDWTAEAVLAINDDIELPANAVARLRQSSLLGEKFIELASPSPEEESDGASGGASGEASDGPDAGTAVPSQAELGEGDVVPLQRTSVGVDVEEVFGAMSMLFNGGGIEQIQTISRELSDVMDGNETQVKAFLDNMDELVSELDDNRAEITSALDGLDTLSATLEGREDQISAALTDLSPGLDSVADQRNQLVTMLDSLDDLSDVAVDTIEESKDDIVADLEALDPLLRGLAEAGEDLPQALEILPTFPFTDAVLDATEGDYMNVSVDLDAFDGYETPIPLLSPPDDDDDEPSPPGGDG